MSITFTKLFSSITESTVWCEPSDIRIVWITMLAMADKKGRVWASVPGLANRARVPVEDARLAITTFLSPDPDSRTSDHEGRRIEAIDGGWRLLNYDKYRATRDDEDRREQTRTAVAKHRANVSQCKPNVSHGKPIAEAEAEAERTKTKTLAHDSGKKLPSSARDDDFDVFWRAYPKKRSKGTAMKAWKRLTPDRVMCAAILAAIEQAKVSSDWQKDDGQYIPYPATWLNGRRWEDEETVDHHTPSPDDVMWRLDKDGVPQRLTRREYDAEEQAKQEGRTR